MKAAVAEFFAKGRGFSSIGGGSKQKKWGCSGKKGGCAAEIRATLQSSKEWKISFVVAEHSNCSGGKAKGKTPSLASFASHAINNDLDMKATEMKRSFEVISGLQVSQWTVTRARGTAVQARPGSVATVEKNPDKTFKRMFVMLGRAAHVVHNSLFKFLQVDAGHLKGEWKGVVLVATAKDTNNKLVLVAFAICDKENASNYSFLLTEMKKNPHMAALLSSTGTTIYSDEHQGISAALKAHASRCIHRLCLHHLIKNLPGPGIGSNVNGWLYHAARVPTQRQCMNLLTTFVKPTKPLAFDSLVKRAPFQWTDWAQPPDTIIMDQVTSNGAESTMNMIGHEARKLPPLGLMISMVENTARKFADRAHLGEGAYNNVTPFASKLFETEREASKGLVVSSTGNGYFSVQNMNIVSQAPRGNRVLLLLDLSSPKWACTCGYVPRYLSPCREIIAVGKELGRMNDVMALVHSAYRLSNYRQLYADDRCRVVLPVLSLIDEDTTLLPPHPVGGQAGRPRKGKDASKRIASNGEKAASAVHNVPFSQLPPTATATAGGLSQGTRELSQGPTPSSAPINIV